MLGVLLLMTPVIVHADTRDAIDSNDSDRFLFGFAFTSGIEIQPQTGVITTSATLFTQPPPGVVPAAPFGKEAVGSFTAVSPYFGANLEVMAPAIDFIPGAPRFFATAEILPTFASENTVALNDAATSFTLPLRLENLPEFFPASSIGGQGSRLRAEVMTTVLAANLGSAFEFEAKGRRMRIKPSVGWIRWGVMANGQVLAAFKDDPIIPPPIVPPYGRNIRYVKVQGEGSDFFNAVGPGLELEMDLQKRGPILPSLFMSGFAYHTVGNDTIVFTASQAVDDALGSAVYNATWTFQVESWSYRAALGFRLRWLGN